MSIGPIEVQKRNIDWTVSCIKLGPKLICKAAELSEPS